MSPSENKTYKEALVDMSGVVENAPTLLSGPAGGGSSANCEAMSHCMATTRCNALTQCRAASVKAAVVTVCAGATCAVTP